MGIITKMFSGLGVKSSEGSFEDMGGYSLHNFGGLTSGKYKKYSQTELLELYKGWVFGACDVIGDGMAGLDIALFKDENKIDKKDHEYLKLIDSEFIKAVSIFLKTVGVVYIYKEVVGNKVIGLRILKSWGVTEEKNELNDVKHYTYFNGKAFFEFQKDDIIKIKTFSPLFESEGFTPLKAVATQVAMDMASIEYNRLFFENGGRPGTVLKHEKKIDENIRDAYLRKWKENFVGLQNSNKVAFLDQGIELQDFSSNQKDMELTNQRVFTMDEILMIFRVPKPLMGKSDGVGFADRRVPGYYFTEYNLKPFSYQIQEPLNKSLFKDIGYFTFEFPSDKEELMKEYQSNLITQNQYLTSTGRLPFKEGNRLWDGSEMTIDEKVKTFESNLFKSIEKGLEKSLIGNKTFGSEDYNQKYWESKIKRTDKYENEMAKIQKKIWSAQEQEIIANLTKPKTKEIKKPEDLFDSKKYNLLYITLYTKFFENFMGAEGKLSISEISDETFAIAKMNKWIGENIDRMSSDIDDTTRKEIFEIIKVGNRDEVGVGTIVASVNSKFSLYTKKNGRVEAITRSEITRASNKSQDEAYKQSGIVQYKEWYTAIDERVCQYCGDLHKKRVGLGNDFIKLGDEHLGEKITYEDVSYPPRHVNCRCTIRPIIARKYFEPTPESEVSETAQKIKEHFEKKGIILNTN